MEAPAFGTMVMTSNGLSYMNFDLVFNLVNFSQGLATRVTAVAYWQSGFNSSIQDVNKKKFDSYKSILTYKVVVAEVRIHD